MNAIEERELKKQTQTRLIKWSEREHSLFLEAVDLFRDVAGEEKWRQIALYIGSGRTIDQVQFHYNIYKFHFKNPARNSDLYFEFTSDYWDVEEQQIINEEYEKLENMNE